MAKATDNLSNLSEALNRGDVAGALEAIGLHQVDFLCDLAPIPSAGDATGGAAVSPSLVEV
jgi:hypothetical protein